MYYISSWIRGKNFSAYFVRSLLLPFLVFAGGNVFAVDTLWKIPTSSMYVLGGAVDPDPLLNEFVNTDIALAEYVCANVFSFVHGYEFLEFRSERVKAGNYQKTVRCENSSGTLFDVLSIEAPLYYYLALPEEINPEEFGSCEINKGNIHIGNPVNPSTGNKFHIEQVVSPVIPGSVGLNIFYNSGVVGDQGIGIGWQHDFNKTIKPTIIASLDNPPSPQIKTSGYFTSPQQACESGWGDVKLDVNESWVDTAVPVYTSEGRCKILSEGDKVWRTLRIYDSPTGGVYHNSNFLTLDAMRSDGKILVYWKSDGVWVNGYSEEYILDATNENGEIVGYHYNTAAGNIENYDVNGVLQSIVTREGRSQSFVYDVNGRLESLVDSFGRAFSFVYDANDHVSQLATPDGVIEFGYDIGNRLVSIAYPDGNSKVYLYEDARFPNALTAIIDENGNRYASYAYDEKKRVVLSEHANGADKVELKYNEDASTTITTHIDNDKPQVRTYIFETIADRHGERSEGG